MGCAHGLCRCSNRCTSIHASHVHDNTTGIGKGIGLRIRSLQALCHRPWTVYIGKRKEDHTDEVIFRAQGIMIVVFTFSRRVCTYG